MQLLDPPREALERAGPHEARARAALRTAVHAVDLARRLERAGARASLAEVHPEALGTLEADALRCDGAAEAEMPAHWRKRGVLSDAALRELSEHRPRLAGWLESSPLALSASALVGAVFVVVDALKPLLYTWAAWGVVAEERPSVAVLNLVKVAVSLLFALSACAASHGREGLRDCMPNVSTLKLIPTASAFLLVNVLSLIALNYVDGATFKLVSQLGILFTTGLSWLVLGRRFSHQQLQALMLTFTAVLFFSLCRRLEEPPRSEGALRASSPVAISRGILWTMLCMLMTSAASVLTEAFLVHDPRPFAAQKAQLEMAGLPCALALFVLLPLTGADVGGDILERGFFVGWSWKFAAMLLYWIPASWLTGLAVKRLSAVTKRVLQCASSLATFSMAVFSGYLVATPLLTLSALMVVQAIFSFFTAPPPEKPMRAEPTDAENCSVSDGAEAAAQSPDGELLRTR